MRGILRTASRSLNNHIGKVFWESRAGGIKRMPVLIIEGNFFAFIAGIQILNPLSVDFFGERLVIVRSKDFFA